MIDPKELKYTKDDEWVRFEGDDAYVGITDYAQSELGDLVFGVVLEVNEDLLDDAALINNDPYGAWFIKVGNISACEDFMTADEYDEYRG